jgi:hypothetical protein
MLFILCASVLYMIVSLSHIYSVAKKCVCMHTCMRISPFLSSPARRLSVMHLYIYITLPSAVSNPRAWDITHSKQNFDLVSTATYKINGNCSDGVPVVNWYKSSVENSDVFCKWQYVWHMDCRTFT